MNSTALRAKTQLRNVAQSTNNTHMIFAYEGYDRCYYEKLEQAGDFLPSRQAGCLCMVRDWWALIPFIGNIAGDGGLWGSSLRKGRGNVLKIRLMGTKNDINWFGKILKRQPKVAVTEFSELYRNKGTDRFYRAYVEVHKANVKEN